MYPFFVYGSLREAGHNHKFLKSSIIRQQEASLPGFVLYSLGLFPMAFKGKGEVIGEIYWVKNESYQQVLKQVDELEEHPHLYYRELHLVKVANNQLLKAWTYVAPVDRSADTLPCIDSGDWFKR